MAERAGDSEITPKESRRHVRKIIAERAGGFEDHAEGEPGATFRKSWLSEKRKKEKRRKRKAGEREIVKACACE